MRADWPRVVVASVGGLIAGFGLANLLARNWLWGDAGYSVEARQPIMFLGLVLIALGFGSIQTVLRGTNSQLRLIAGMQLALVSATPLIMTLNIGGWDRVYADTNWPLVYIAAVFSVIVGLPAVLAYLAIRRTHEY